MRRADGDCAGEGAARQQQQRGRPAYATPISPLCPTTPTYLALLYHLTRSSSPLLENSSVEKVQEVDAHVGVAISGLAADARSLVDHARVEAASHRFTYDEPLRVESLTQSICDLKMSFGEGGDDEDEDEEGEGGGGRKKAKMSRPFGVSLLVAGCDARGPQLYCTDPSGTYVAWDAQAIGNGSEAARTILQERYAKAMTLDAAAALIVRVLSETMEEKVRAARRGPATSSQRACSARAGSRSACHTPLCRLAPPLPPPPPFL